MVGREIDLGDAYLFAVFVDLVHELLNMLWENRDFGDPALLEIRRLTRHCVLRASHPASSVASPINTAKEPTS